MIEMEYTAGPHNYYHSVDDDITSEDLLQEFYQFMVGCGYVFDYGVRSFEDYVVNEAMKIVKELEDAKTKVSSRQFDSYQEQVISRWSPDCLKSSSWACPSRTGDGKCSTTAPCQWRQGYEPND